MLWCYISLSAHRTQISSGNHRHCNHLHGPRQVVRIGKKTVFREIYPKEQGLVPATRHLESISTLTLLQCIALLMMLRALFHVMATWNLCDRRATSFRSLQIHASALGRTPNTESEPSHIVMSTRRTSAGAWAHGMPAHSWVDTHGVSMAHAT